MIAGVIIGVGSEGREGLGRCGSRDGSCRWGCAGSHGPGDDEPGGVGEEPRCSAWLMREAAHTLLSFFLFLFFYTIM